MLAHSAKAPPGCHLTQMLSALHPWALLGQHLTLSEMGVGLGLKCGPFSIPPIIMLPSVVT